MSDSEDWKPRKGYLLKNYPVEAFFLLMHYRNDNDMLQRFDSGPDDNVNEPRIFCFQTIKRSDTDYRELMLNMPVLLFMGGWLKQFQYDYFSVIPNIIPKRNKCSICNTINNRMSKYCLQFGSEFES